MSVGERNYTVYMHVNKTNNKCYIGITSTNPKRRWRSDGSGYKSNPYFYNAIKKYGWDNFEHTILFENKSKEEAESLEVLFIKILLSNNNSYGYNIANGGNSNGMHSLESKIKISEGNIGKITFSKKVICENIIFNTIKDCAKYYNVAYPNMVNWLSGRNGVPLEFIDKNLKYLNEENVQKPQTDKKRGGSCRAKKVICDGVIFDCLKDCAEYYNLNYSTVRSWIVGINLMPQSFISKGLKYVDEKLNIKEIVQSKKVICEEKIYNSITECASFYDINRATMNDWLTGKHKMPLKFINLGLRYLDNHQEYYPQNQFDNSKRIRFNRKIYNSIKDFSNCYNISYSIVGNWLRGRTKMPQQYIDFGLRYATEEDLNIYELYNEN